jgi:hypothetical protein
MTGTTKSLFNGETEGLEVAAAFADAIRGKTVLITGVNHGGIGFTTAEAFVTLVSFVRNEPKLTTWTVLSIAGSHCHRRTQHCQSPGKHRFSQRKISWYGLSCS